MTNQTELDRAPIRFALDSVLASLTVDPNRSVEDLKNERTAATAMLGGLLPADAIQAALAARIVAMHHAAMECLRRAAQPDVPSALAAKLLVTSMSLSRMSTQLMKVLADRQDGITRALRSSGPARPVEAALAAGVQAPAAGAPAAVAAGSAARTAAHVKNPMHQNAAASGGNPMAAFAAAGGVVPTLSPADLALLASLTAAVKATA
jgi:hypothetical protein